MVIILVGFNFVEVIEYFEKAIEVVIGCFGQVVAIVVVVVVIVLVVIAIALAVVIEYLLAFDFKLVSCSIKVKIISLILLTNP